MRSVATVAMLGAASLALVGSTAGMALAEPPASYLGAGLRIGLNDDAAFVINSKLRVVDMEEASLSVRPAVLFDDETEVRLPVTFEGTFGDGVHPYAGAGIAINADGSGDVNPMVAGGLDLALSQNLILDLRGNVLFKDSDTDAEFMATLNYAF